MKRNFQTLGLVLAGAFAFCAIAVPAAFAQAGIFTTPAPVTLSGTEIGTPAENRLTAFGGSWECDSVHTGYKYKTTPHTAFVPNLATGVTLLPHYTNCKDSEGTPRTIDMNGCDYSITIGEATPTNEAHTYGATMWLECPTGKVTEITNTPCGTTKIAPQGPLHGLHIRHMTTPSHDLAIKGTVTGVHATCGGFLTTNEAELHINVTVKGKDALGNEEPITVTASVAPVQTTGKITTPAPATLTGTEIGTAEQNRLTAFGVLVECDSFYTVYKYKSTPHTYISNLDTGVTVIPHYTNCKDPESGAARTVDMNGCDYSITIGETTPTNEVHTYGATAWLECPAGKFVEVTGTACGALKFAPQGPLHGLHVRQVTTPSHHLVLEGTVTGLHATCLGGFLTQSSAELHINVTSKNDDVCVGEGPVTVTH
jgi:hypothetical protein